MQDSGHGSGYTIDEAAEILQFHPDAVRYWVRVGELPGERDETRGGWLIQPEDLALFLRASGETIRDLAARADQAKAELTRFANPASSSAS
jgi:excisionase family DNA binding protein